MSFSKVPSKSTYQTKPVRLFKEMNPRGSVPGQYDEDFVNVYFELVKNRITGENTQYVVKRAGGTTFGTPGTYSNIRGTYFWEDLGRLYIAAGRDLLYYDVSTAAIGATYVNFFSGSTGDVGFTEFLYDTNTVNLIVTDGTTLKEITSAGVITTCVDADLPSPHVPVPVFIDGYLFLLKSSTADVYNSDLNNPQSWTAGNFLTAEMSPDTCNMIHRLNNYLVVFGTNSIEYFWDAAAATGSPMQRNDTPFKNTGYLGGLTSLGNKAYFVGNENESEPAVYMLEDFKMTKISTEAVSRYLSGISVAYNTFKATFVSFNGHMFYVLNAGTKTWVMELETKLWTRWDWQSTGNGFPVVAAANTKSSNAYKCIVAFSTTGQLYTMSPSVYQDAGTNFTCTIQTPSNEFETMNRKFFYRFIIWADRPSANSSIYVSWSDDDYQSFSTPIGVNMNQDICCLYRQGQARARNYKLTYTDNYPMRIQLLEVDINMGQT